MAKKVLKKFEYVTDLRVETVELTDEQAELFEKDEDAFWDKYDDLDWEYSHSKAGDPDPSFELDNDE